MFLLAVFLPLLFPTGHPTRPVWSWVAVMAGVGMIGGLIGACIEVLTLPVEQVLGDDSSTWWIINATLVVGIVGAGASVIARIRHATVVERQQIKWEVLVLGIVTSLVLLSFDRWVGFMAPRVWRVNAEPGLTLYGDHMGQRHLDVGPGTGYFIAESKPPTSTQLTLVDPNPSVLEHCAVTSPHGSPDL